MDGLKHGPSRRVDPDEATRKQGVQARGGGSIDEEGGSQLTLPLSRQGRGKRAEQASTESGEKSVTEHEYDPANTTPVAPIELHERAPMSFGQRLLEAREQRGWSSADVAARLKLPIKLIARLENDDYEGLTQGVFLRGYLASYARLVGVPVQQAASVAAAHSYAAPLVATGAISRSRYLFDRYSVSATYLVLTAIIVVPAVWLATHGGLEQNLARTTPLDPPAAAVAPARDAAIGADDALAAISVRDSAGVAEAPAPTQAAPTVDSRPQEQAPVIASMTPFNVAPAPAAAAPAEASNAATAGSGKHVLELTLSEPSWVEITTVDGRKLEYGILAAGSERTYRSDGPISVRLGNAQGARMQVDGAPIDLAPYQRANVARVTLFGANGASRTD